MYHVARLDLDARTREQDKINKITDPSIHPWIQRTLGRGMDVPAVVNVKQISYSAYLNEKERKFFRDLIELKRSIVGLEK